MKKLLLIFTFLFFFSSNSFAGQLCRVISGGGYEVGSIVDISIIPKQKPNDRVSGCSIKWEYKPNKFGTWFTGAAVSSCNGSDVVDPETGVCGSPTCPVGHTPNEETGECDPPAEDFCSSSEWLELSATEGNACAAQYPNHLTDFSASCVSRDDYSFTCNQGIEKPPVTDPDPTD
ncbi:hypothetical protein, partial [Vibrio splendidus]|uniref:hypothetical protein n=1 Tax=Vibrio splendidus TaxID=29497 RepID=UPI0010546E09